MYIYIVQCLSCKKKHNNNTKYGKTHVIAPYNFVNDFYLLKHKIETNFVVIFFFINFSLHFSP